MPRLGEVLTNTRTLGARHVGYGYRPRLPGPRQPPPCRARSRPWRQLRSPDTRGMDPRPNTLPPRPCSKARPRPGPSAANAPPAETQMLAPEPGDLRSRPAPPTQSPAAPIRQLSRHSRLWRSRVAERSGTPRRREMAARPGAGRITDWLSVWLSESERSGTVVSPQYSIPMACIGFSPD